jgi:cytochrome c oxidase cbb3-type subunit III
MSSPCVTDLPSPVRETPFGKWAWTILPVILLLTGYLLGSAHLRREHLAHRLLASDPDSVIKDPALTRFAADQAKPLYAANCASCHAADMTGNATVGAPNLSDGVWLYGNGSVFDIERTLLYGVRSGLSKSHNIADMPAFGLTGVLSAGDVRDVVQYVLQLSGRPHQSQAAREGRSLFFGTANCGDCHGGDGRGNPDYGAPNLTANVWNSGGDPQSLYDAIYFGQHRVMPAWIGTLSLEQIRALAVYVYTASHH